MDADAFRIHRARFILDVARNRLNERSHACRSAIASNDADTAGRMANDAMHEARYMEWVQAKLNGTPFCGASCRGREVWKDPTRTKPVYS